MCDYCSWIDQILARIRAETKPKKKKHKIHVDPVVIVHGGAAKISRKKRQRMLVEVKNAAIESYKVLINGRSAVEAVEKAISYMEDQPLFNCAKGGSLDVNDEVVMDAAIMTINDAGCVGAVRDIEHPISLARKVLENTTHVLIVESGAQKLALESGFTILPPGTLNVCESLSSYSSGEQMSFDSCTMFTCPSHLNQKKQDEGEVNNYVECDNNAQCDNNDQSDNIDQCVNIDQSDNIDQCVNIDQSDNIDQCVNIDQSDNIDQCVNIDQSDNSDQSDNIDQCNNTGQCGNTDQCDNTDQSDNVDQCDNNDQRDNINQCDNNDKCDNKKKKVECDSNCVIKRCIQESRPFCAFDTEELLDDLTVLQTGAVGAVAFDRKRRLASGTSTAGEPGKPIGLVSAIGTVVGCGVYTDEHGCTSVSGDDLNIYSYAPARKITRKLSQGVEISTAVNTVLENFEQNTGESNIGAIALNCKGEPCVSFKCSHFPWAICHKGYVYYGSMQDERFWEKITVLERPLDCMCISSDDD